MTGPADPAPEASEAIRFSREMSITLKEFLRSLPPAVAPIPFTVSGRTITIDDGNRSVRIELSPERERRLGLLRLPVTDVAFTFQGYDRPEFERFMQRFDRAFQRGGG
jgi:hypothetical protein